MKCKSTGRYGSRLSTLVFMYKYICLSARIRKRKGLEKSWLCTANCCSVWVHRTDRWCTPGRALANWPLSGIRRWRMAIIHWTVRWCIRLPGEPTAASATVGRQIREATRGLLQRSAGCTGLSGVHRTVSGEPTAARATVGRAIRARRVAHAYGWGHRTVRCAPDSVRCANQPEDPTIVCAMNGRRSAPDMLQWLSGGAPDCPVRHPTEGKNCLCWVPMAPSCLGAINGTPRHMEEIPKHTLSILNLPHSVSVHLIDFLSDLSSVLVVNLLRFIRAQVLVVCVRIAADLCVASLPYSSAFILIFVVRARDSKLWRFLANGKEYKKENNHDIQVDHWIT
jgi:hypothetical protein